MKAVGVLETFIFSNWKAFYDVSRNPSNKYIQIQTRAVLNIRK